ncbi:MAG: 3-phosphoshikimate 1-carboxyvinyltransferase [Alphaproteobacteria bacterium MarineAlpha2_Bin1]|nr:MAG: 3-phosphoshikimate 1-carboxyvinyltransferase [Alphaproteobacteria bacterium MarineAlpha2_Bin1]|tara:strand:+ start:1407 stop:2729 length:1323 start_codon:yes stop_codon:yes gene_type:complete
MKNIISSQSTSINGSINIPGDKSISHRSLIISSLAIGKTTIKGILKGKDIISSKNALEKMGVIIKEEKDIFIVYGVGSGGLLEPDDVLDLGNSGTSARLLIGLISSHKMIATLTGDDSLRKRPMKRVIDPSEKIGAKIISNNNDKLPLTIFGTNDPLPINYKLSLPSAQVKSSILLAGLQAPGETCIEEVIPSRDHTERMLECFGAKISVNIENSSKKMIRIKGQNELSASNIEVPGDFSSASFFIVAALIVPDSNLYLKNIGINPYRIGLIEILQEMGAKLELLNKSIRNNEPVADIRVYSSDLKGVEVPSEISPKMIDEYPILSIAACMAKGKTILRGLDELRYKESNRLKSIVEMLMQFNVSVKESEDQLLIENKKQIIEGNCTIKTFQDHRIAMSAIIGGLVSKGPVHIDDSSMIETSFPGFIDIINSVGGRVSEK